MKTLSEHKNKLLIAITVAVISVILLSTVSYVFFPVDSNSEPAYLMWISKSVHLGTILIANDGNVNSTAFKQTGTLYTQTGDIVNQTILVQKNDISLDGSGHTLENSEIFIQDQSNITISNMRFTDFSIPEGIVLNGSSNCLITGNTVLKTPGMIVQWLSLENSCNNVISGNSLDTANIDLMFSSNNTLIGNSIIDVLAEGIHSSWSQNNTISSNHFDNVLTAVEVDNNGSNAISENNMVNCDQGVRAIGLDNQVFGNNMTFADLGYHQQGADWMTGIVIDGSNNSVYKNIIQGFALAGISVSQGASTILNDGRSHPGQGAGNVFFDNIIACNNYGVFVGPEGGLVDGNQFYHNDFINNNQTVFVCSPASAEANDGKAYYVNQWNSPLEGNYWSDYAQKYPAATELYNSTTMNMPYQIDDYNFDSHPLMAPYMQEDVSDYSNPYTGQPLFPYVVRQTLLCQTGNIGSNYYDLYVEFYSPLPPNVTISLNPTIPVANETTGLRDITFVFAEPLLVPATYSATITYGQESNLRSYSWNFTT